MLSVRDWYAGEQGLYGHIQGRRGFVKHNEFRICGNRPGNSYLLSLIIHEANKLKKLITVILFLCGLCCELFLTFIDDRSNYFGN